MLKDKVMPRTVQARFECLPVFTYCMNPRCIKLFASCRYTYIFLHIDLLSLKLKIEETMITFDYLRIFIQGS
jgi:hypothetical protein